jgi:hypothetical protein
MTDTLEWFLPIFCIGNLLFITILTDHEVEANINDIAADESTRYVMLRSFAEIFIGASALNKFGVCVGVIHYYLPTKDINKFMWDIKEEFVNPIHYSEARKNVF